MFIFAGPGALGCITFSLRVYRGLGHSMFVCLFLHLQNIRNKQINHSLQIGNSRERPPLGSFVLSPLFFKTSCCLFDLNCNHFLIGNHITPVTHVFLLLFRLKILVLCSHCFLCLCSSLVVFVTNLNVVFVLQF